MHLFVRRYEPHAIDAIVLSMEVVQPHGAAVFRTAAPLTRREKGRALLGGGRAAEP